MRTEESWGIWDEVLRLQARQLAELELSPLLQEAVSAGVAATILDLMP